MGGMRLLRSFTIGLSLALSPNTASACLPPLQRETEVVRDIASSGTMFSGTVIQAFDARRRRPEIIRADRIYVGDGQSKNFVIYRDDNDFRMGMRGPIAGPPSCRAPKAYTVGEKIYRLILMPAVINGRATGRWRFTMLSVNVMEGQGLEALIAEATTRGRFQARP